MNNLLNKREILYGKILGPFQENVEANSRERYISIFEILQSCGNVLVSIDGLIFHCGFVEDLIVAI